MHSLQGNSEMKSGVQNADWELTSKKERERKQQWAEGEVELGWKPDKTLEQILLTQVVWDWVEWLDLYTSTLLSHQYKMFWEGHDLERGGCLQLRGADSWRPSADCTHSLQLGCKSFCDKGSGQQCISTFTTLILSSLSLIPGPGADRMLG